MYYRSLVFCFDLGEVRRFYILGFGYIYRVVCVKEMDLLLRGLVFYEIEFRYILILFNFRFVFWVFGSSFL